jgi:hypothetical protein
MSCGEQGELVARQHPDRAPRDRERDRADASTGDLVKEVLDQLDVRRAPEGERTRYRRDRQRPARDDEHVVLDLGVLGGVRDVAPDVDADQSTRREAGADSVSEALELELLNLAELERCRDRQRTVRELRVGGEELHAHATLGKIAKRQRRLEGRDPPACNEDMHPVRGS